MLLLINCETHSHTKEYYKMKWILSVVLVLSFSLTFATDNSLLKDNKQRIIMVTGSTGGLGREVARALAEMGDHVILHGRNIERGRALEKELNDKRAGSAKFYRADFGSLKEIQKLSEVIINEYKRIDVLVNNAGIALIGDKERRLSEDGYELHFQVNYLAEFLLTNQLLTLIERGKTRRIVNVASGSASPLEFDNLMLEKNYSTMRAYGQSKLSQVMHTIELSIRLRRKGIVVNSLHPSTFMDTDMILEAGLKPRSSVMDGRDAVLNLVNNKGVGNGEFYNVQTLARAHDQAYDAAVRERLWMTSEYLIADKLK